jgi:hypothetical protein
MKKIHCKEEKNKTNPHGGQSSILRSEKKESFSILATC